MAVQTMWSVVRRFLFWAIPVTLVATLVWMVVPHERSAPPTSSQAPPAHPVVHPAPPPGDAESQEAADRSPDSPPYAQIQRGDLVGTDDAGHERWRIVADQVTVVEDKETVLLRNVWARFYEKAGGTITVTGANGRYDTKTRKVEIQGHVHGKSSSGRELFADRLRWEPASRRLTGTGHVRLVQNGVTMYADELISDTTLGQTRFFGHVHAAVR